MSWWLEGVLCRELWRGLGECELFHLNLSLVHWGGARAASLWSSHALLA